jgi:hypothetical protein
LMVSIRDRREARLGFMKPIALLGVFAALFHIFFVPIMFIWNVEYLELVPFSKAYKMFFTWGQVFPPPEFVSTRFNLTDPRGTDGFSSLSIWLCNTGLALRDNDYFAIGIFLGFLVLVWLRVNSKLMIVRWCYYIIIVGYFVFYLLVAISAFEQFSVLLLRK